MKRKNNKNIITSDDITILGENLKGRYGNTLEDVLEKMSEAQDSLKSNVKWLYKYGGVGGKGGGGGGTSTFSDTWQAIIQLTKEDGKTLTVPLVDQEATSDSYQMTMFKSASKISILISNPQAQEFKAKIYYGGRLYDTVTFNREQSYSKISQIEIKNNGNLEVQVYDTGSLTDPKKYALRCITDAYRFSDKILYDDGTEISKNSTRNVYISFMDDILSENGRGNLKYKLKATTNYKFPLKIVWTTIDGVPGEYIFNEDSSVMYNNVELLPEGIPIINDPTTFFSGNAYDKAGTYIFNVKKYILSSKPDEPDTLIEDTDFQIDLIPSELYLSIQTNSNFIIYNSTQVENPQFTYVGNKQFILTPYNGNSYDGSTVYIKIKIGDSYYTFPGGSQISMIPTRENSYPVLRITLPEGGNNETWVTLVFYVCPDNQFDVSTTKTFTRYLRVRKYDNNINWYSNNVIEAHEDLTSFGTHYRYGESSSSTNYLTNNGIKLDGSTLISKSVNDDSISIITSDLLTGLSDKRECLINIGLQYNDINDETQPIIKIGENSRNSSDDFVTTGPNDIIIYQNSITHGTTPMGYADKQKDGTINYISGFFINKEVNYKESDMGKYQLITIARRAVKQVDAEGGGTRSVYEIAIYINGVLQTCKQDFTSITTIYSKFILNNGNYSINLLDIQYLNDGSLSDASVVRYWYAYNTTIQGENIEEAQTREELLNVFETDFTYELYNNYVNSRVQVSYAGFKSLCRLQVPIMCVKYDRSSNKGIPFMDWSDEIRPVNGENTTDDVVNVQVWWKSKNEIIEDPASKLNVNTVKRIPKNNIDNNESEDGESKDDIINGQFTLAIQGSTTRNYKSKNYTLTLDGLSSSNTYIPLFTPFFEKVEGTDSDEVKKHKYNHSLLPEQSFTLKADVVDSSHTNNTCMGSFINDICTKFNLAISQNGIYSKYIKNCLTGFPFLMFSQEIVNGKEEMYYLGIYNFNLGRSSYFNLGYVDISLLDDFDINGDFSDIYYVEQTKYKNVRSGFISTEIQDNRSQFDFSQYDPTILFNIGGTRDVDFMFDDFVPKKEDLSIEKASITNFVKSISRAGGYIFTRLGKGFHNEDINVGDEAQNPGYSIKHYVPQATQQWEKYETNDGKILYRKKSGPPEDPFISDDLYNCIFSHTNLIGKTEEAYCDYRSLVEYYTVCMAFGLLDSVQKNLTIKTWNNNDSGIGTYHTAFYDMDTCLGINNDAGDVKYFAFSDYWENSESDSNQTINITGIQQAQPVYNLTSIEIVRDYTPNTEDQTDFFDVPSNYLFAIAKYAKSVLTADGSNRANELVTPQDLWACWRADQTIEDNTTTIGCLTNSQKFLDNYYYKYMEGINELMFNYNYRAKYFNENRTVGNVYDVEQKRFHGNRHNYVKDWLTKRFHILDAYFNLNRSVIPINDGQRILDGGVADCDEPIYANTAIDFITHNDDVQITKDIFGNSGIVCSTPDLQDITTWLIVKAPDYTPIMIRENNSIRGRYLLSNDSHYYSIVFTGGTASRRVNFLGSTLWTYLHNINFINGACNINSRYLENLVGYKGNISTWNISLPSLKFISLTSPNYSGTLNLDQSSEILYPNLRSVDISNSGISLTINGGNIKDVVLNNVSATSLSLINCYSLRDVQCNNLKISGSCSIGVSWNKDFSLNSSGIRVLSVSSESTEHGNFKISNDEVLTTLNVKSFKDIEVHKCDNLEEFISDSSNVESIIITDCKNLRRAEINVTNCRTLIIEGALEELTLKATSINDFGNLTTLGIKGSTFENIYCRTIVSNQILNPATDVQGNNVQGLLNLSIFTGLNGGASATYKLLTGDRKLLGGCYIKSNTNIKYIQFANNKNNPIIISEKAPFEGLTNLERIYGNIQFKNCNALFQNLNHFSIHGLTNNEGKITVERIVLDETNDNGNITVTPRRTNGQYVTVSTEYNKTRTVFLNDVTYHVVQTPLQLISGESSAQTEWDHNTIMKYYDAIYNIGIEALWQSGDKVTNISFHPNVDKNFGYIGWNSGLSQFDIYYLFNSLALSHVNTTGIYLTYAFSTSTDYSLNNYRTFKFSEGNQFNRYMFYKCANISELGYLVFPTTYAPNGSNVSLSEEHVIYPPSNNGEQVQYDNGLFSPLPNLKTVSNFCANCYTNRFIFRRSNTKYNSLATVNHLGFSHLQDDINNYKFKTSLPPVSITDTKYGSLDKLFEDAPNIKDILNSFNSYIIDYSTIEIPTSITSIVDCFSSTYGKGTFDWGYTFKSENTYNALSRIDNSFRINNGINGVKVDFELYDDMLINMPSLMSLGYSCNDSTKPNSKGYESTDYHGTRILENFAATKTGTTLNVGFSGLGYNKKLRNGQFPYRILQKLQNQRLNNQNFDQRKKIINFAGLFSYLDSGAVSGGEITFPGIPDTNLSMFSECEILEDISGLFMNATVKIKLTSDGFKDCRNLNNVTRLFYSNEAIISSGNISDGYIPYRFFYTGLTNKDSNYQKVYFSSASGTQYSSLNINDIIANVNDNRNENNQATKLSDLTPEELSQNNLVKQTVEYNEFRKSIVYAAECFYGQNNLQCYKWNGTNYNNNPLYKNPNYIPFEHYVDEETNEWRTRENTPLYTCEFDVSKLYDGTNILSSDQYCKNSDDVIVEGGQETRYICPPDMFSSFQNIAAVSIRGFFKWCGYSIKTGSHTYRKDVASLSGRICPYLFDDISSVTALMEVFENCKGLTVYKISGDTSNNYYILPPTIFNNLKSLNNISKMLSGIKISKTVSWPFSSLSGRSLNIRGLFACCEYPSGISITMSSIFNGLKLSNISGVFCSYLLTLDNTDYNNTSTITNSNSQGDGVHITYTIHQDNYRSDSVQFSNNFSGANLTKSQYTKFLYLGYDRGTNRVVESSLTSIINQTQLQNIGVITS